MSDFMNMLASPTLPKMEVRIDASDQLKQIRDLREADKEEKAFKDFEQMFVHLMLKEMRKTMNEGSFTEKSHATKMYEEMMDEALAAQMAESGQMGLGRQLRETMQAERLRQEVQASEKSMTNNALE